MDEVWYRAGVSEYFDSVTWEPAWSVYYCECPVLRHTKCGVWLDNFGRKRFCLKDAARSFAKPTKSEALQSLIFRREKQIKILNDSLATATAELAAAKKEQSKEVANGDNR